ncbi:phage tail-collar fiber domain-containing protein, partial [Shewanella sp.]
MAQVITLAGERLFALKAQNNEALDIDTFIFAKVPGQDSNTPIDRNEGLPPPNQIVHDQAVQQVGMINENVVVYSSVLDSLTGPFEFNWVGLYSSTNQTLVAISHIPTATKTVTVPGAAGNLLNRNFAIEYSGIAELSGITVTPETWQLDQTARLNGMGELTRQLAADMNGRDWFIDEGFKVMPRPALNTFKVTAGAGYVSGLRATLDADEVIIVSQYPKFVYVDTSFYGTANATWKPKVMITVSSSQLDNYIDTNGVNHYLCKVAAINGADSIEDLRKSGYSSNFVLTEANNDDEETAAFAAGALAVVRIDLIAPRSSLYMDFKSPFAFIDKSEFYHQFNKIHAPTIDTVGASPMGMGVADLTAGYLKTPDSPELQLTSGWGIECYFKLSATQKSHFIVSKGLAGNLKEGWYLALVWTGASYL